MDVTGFLKETKKKKERSTLTWSVYHGNIVRPQQLQTKTYLEKALFCFDSWDQNIDWTYTRHDHSFEYS